MSRSRVLGIRLIDCGDSGESSAMAVGSENVSPLSVE
jgi:hypothetical protein